MRRTVFIVVLLGLYAAGHSQEWAVVPEWFLRPAEGEYVGVSFPGENTLQTREDCAVVTALISYGIAHPKENGFTEQSGRVDSGTASQQKITKEYVQMTNELSLENITYKIVRNYINNRGEVFVAVRILQEGSGRFSARYVSDNRLCTEVDSIHSKTDLLWKCRYADDMQKSQIAYDLYFQSETDMSKFDNRHNDSVKIEILSDNGESEYAAFDSKNENQTEHGYPDTSPATTIYTCKNSLHAAYMRYLGDAGKYETPPQKMSIINNCLVISY